MKKFKADELLTGLAEDVKILLQCAEFFKGETEGLLKQYAPDKWSVTQVMEHLNRYGDYYLPAISKAITTDTKSERGAWFTSGRLGEFFVNAIRPKSLFNIKSKMKAAKAYNPSNNLNAEAVLTEFIKQQHTLLQLLELSKQRDLNTIAIPISFTKLVKLKLGDTFRFLIAHEQRHIIQARNTLHAVGVSTEKFPVILREALQ